MDIQQKKILLVEDDLFIRELYQRSLGKAGYHVIAAADGEQGLNAAKNQLPDIILLDLMLPKINGIEVLKKLREDENTKTIPVILLTNLGEDQILKEALAIGVGGYIVKAHLTPQQIVQRVSEMLTKQESSTSL